MGSGSWLVAGPSLLAEEGEVLAKAWPPTDAISGRLQGVPVCVPKEDGPPLLPAGLKAASLTFQHGLQALFNLLQCGAYGSMAKAGVLGVDGVGAEAQTRLDRFWPRPRNP